MDHTKLMEKVMHQWATKLKLNSHVFLAKLLKPAFKAAYNAGKLDNARKSGNSSNGVRAGFNKIKEMTGVE